jgi:nucleoid DNA-binding protein
MALTKEQIVVSIQNHLGISRKRSLELVETLQEIIKKILHLVIHYA